MINKLSSHPPIVLIECVNEEPTKEASQILKNHGYNFYRINESNKKLIRVKDLIVIKAKNNDGISVLDRNNLNALCVPRQITESELSNLLTDI